ncbi:kinesin-like protein KIF9 [Chanos chanos]|uniref:Kinesin-like protein n=1 Tax=Chanos chanos TaxID=29144 RepID=A0A6J2VUZ6_CHACN|nr:kinesin-like protein KIF9 [Chanos chanos]
MTASGSEVRVYVRTRPTAAFAQDLIEYLPDKETVNIHQRRVSRKGIVNNQLSSWSFHLDGVLHDVSQEEVYECVARSVVLGALEGYNGTVMCFGQTGAGKTYTMTGATESYRQRGIIPRALQEVFREIELRADYSFSVRLSYLEIYNETLVDLLSSVKGVQGPQGGNMAVIEEAGRGIWVKGLSLHPIHNEEEALNLLFEGEMNRIIGAHALNKHSSRSHCIFTIHIESRSCTQSDAKYVTSKLNLVDLAGSERLSKTGSEGQGQKEAMYINKSLSFLEQAILALADRRREHVPFRQSKLTHALKDSLGGNCNTVLVANIYGEAAQIEETLSTLRFASRMKCVRTVPSINEHDDPVLQVRRLQKEIRLLKQELSIQNTLANRRGVSYEPLSETQVAEVKSQVRRYLEGSANQIMIVNVRQVQEVFAQFKQAMQEQEQRIREKLLQDYSLVEKTAKTEGPPPEERHEPKGTAGKLEGRGFGLGMAPPSERYVQSVLPNRSKAKRAKEMSSQMIPVNSSCRFFVSRKGDAGSPGPNRQAEAPGPGPRPAGQEDPNLESQDQETQLAGTRADSPPPKEEAFEDFKVERGSEINRILKENKAVLLERRALLRTLTDTVNEVKREIDKTASDLRTTREQRLSQGEFVGVEGEPVLDEEELSLVLRLRELKGRYRQEYEELVNTKAEVRYCQHLVDQCRIRLLTEFEIWYNESFLLPEEVQTILNSNNGPLRPGLVPVDKALALEEDEEDRTACLRQTPRPDSPNAVSFYNAHNRTLKRRGSRPQSQGSGQRRRSSSRMGTGAGRVKFPAIFSVT